MHGSMSAAGGNQASRASTRRTVQAPPADPTATPGAARVLLCARSARGVRGRSLAGPPRPAARPEPPFSGASALPPPLLFPRQFSLLAQSHFEEHQEHGCAKAERDQRDGEHFAGQPADQNGADRTSDNERRGRSKRQDARAGRHRRKVSLRLAAERTRALGTRVPLLAAAVGESRREKAQYVCGGAAVAGGVPGAAPPPPTQPSGRARPQSCRPIPGCPSAGPGSSR
jgi:hypothetical protein